MMPTTLIKQLKSKFLPISVISCASFFLAGCDYFGIEAPANLEARIAGEAKAVGGACRQAGRAIEDCFALNPKMPRAPVMTGWREMNDYMRENNLESTRPEIAPNSLNPTPEAPAQPVIPEQPQGKTGAPLPI